MSYEEQLKIRDAIRDSKVECAWHCTMFSTVLVASRDNLLSILKYLYKNHRKYYYQLKSSKDDHKLESKIWEKYDPMWDVVDYLYLVF